MVSLPVIYVMFTKKKNSLVIRISVNIKYICQVFQLVGDVVLRLFQIKIYREKSQQKLPKHHLRM